MLSSEVIERITNRHIGRVLQRLDEIDTASIIKECVKGEMWLISDDMKQELAKQETTQCQEENQPLRPEQLFSVPTSNQ